MRPRTESLATVANSRIPSVDIAIVGGGIAGLYTAYRLRSSTTYSAASIALIDALDTLGGRIRTLRIPGIPWVADIGAMRYCTTQPLICSLVESLSLTTYEHTYPLDSYFLRGRDLFHASGFPDLLEKYKRRNPERAPVTGPQDTYRYLFQEERGRTPEDLVRLAISKVLAELNLDPSSPKLTKKLANLDASAVTNIALFFQTLSPKEWTTIFTAAHFRGEPLYNLSFWDVVQAVLSTDAYSLSEAGLGYHTILGGWNAADAIPWFLADFSGAYRSIEGGMGKLPGILLDQITNNSSRPLSLNQGSLSVLTGRAVASIRSGAASPQYILSLTTPGEPRELAAHKVIFALPRTPLKTIFRNSDQGLWRGFADALDSVCPQPLMKMFWFYDSPWWWHDQNARLRQFDLGVDPLRKEFRGSKIITDLPIRQIHCYGPRSPLRIQGTQELECNAMLMAYCDARYTEFWSILAHRDSSTSFWAASGLFENLHAEKRQAAREILSEFGVSLRLKERAAAELWRIYGHRLTSNKPPEPLTGLFLNWMRKPFCGGWHTWNVGARSPEVRRQLVNPARDIFICGEAFSADQGWIEGALRSAERALVDGLGLPPVDLTEVGRDTIANLGFSDLEEYLRW